MSLGVQKKSLVNGHSGNTPGQGPFMDITLEIHDWVIVNASYQTYQCPGCVACGKAICELVTGLTAQKAGEITHPTLLEKVGPLPRHRQICYSLALLALSDALKNLQQRLGD